MLVGRVVRESTELVLDGFRKGGVVDDRILCLFIREVGIKIGHIKDGFLNQRVNLRS